MSLDIIKEYLVSLGFNVDGNSFNQAMGAMNTAEKSVSKFAGASISSFAAAGAAVTAFTVTAAAGIYKFLDGIAWADLKNQEFARQMWTSVDAARAYNNTLKSMGVTLQDLWLSPELLRNFQALQDQAKNMQVGGDFEEQMQFIRSIRYEFQRLKLEGTYALQWIGYYLIKYLQTPLMELKIDLKSLNDSLQENMPHWTKRIAEVASWFARLGLDVGHLVIDIRNLFDSMPKSARAAGAGIMAFVGMLQLGPIGVFIVSLTALLLLLDDFYTYKSGGDSLLGGFWKQLDDKNGLVGKFSQGIKDVSDWLSNLYTMINSDKSLQNFGKTLEDLAVNTGDLASTIMDLINKLTQLAGFQNFGDMLNKNIVSALKSLSEIIKGINDDMESMNKLLHGDFKGAIESGASGNSHMQKGIFGAFGLNGDFDKNFNVFSDKFWSDAGDNLISGFAQGWNSIWGKLSGVNVPKDFSFFSNPAYTKPQVAAQGNPSVSLNPTYHVYGGSSPESTAQAIQSNENALLIRALQGVIR